LSFSGAGTTAVLPGTYTVTPGGLTSTNYAITFVNGTLNITYGTCTGSDPGSVILPPINSDGTSVYKRKAGSTIPVKFKVCDANGNSISDPNVVFPTGCCGSVTLTSVRRGTVDNVNENATTDIPGSAFTYSGDHWQLNMSTTNLNAGDTDTFRIYLRYGYIEFTVGLK
jgi:MBG domain-containing protein